MTEIKTIEGAPTLKKRYSLQSQSWFYNDPNQDSKIKIRGQFKLLVIGIVH